MEKNEIMEKTSAFGESVKEKVLGDFEPCTLSKDLEENAVEDYYDEFNKIREGLGVPVNQGGKKLLILSGVWLTTGVFGAIGTSLIMSITSGALKKDKRVAVLDRLQFLKRGLDNIDSDNEDVSYLSKEIDKIIKKANKTVEKRNK